MTRGFMLAGGGAGLAAAALAGFLLLRPAEAAVESGVFENDCCGTLRLEPGGMVLSDRQTVRYSTGRDSRGPYLLPRTYVGAFEDRGIEIDGTRPALKLRLDKLPAPDAIELYEGRQTYVFRRKPVPPRHPA